MIKNEIYAQFLVLQHKNTSHFPNKKGKKRNKNISLIFSTNLVKMLIFLVKNDEYAMYAIVLFVIGIIYVCTVESNRRPLLSKFKYVYQNKGKKKLNKKKRKRKKKKTKGEHDKEPNRYGICVTNIISLRFSNEIKRKRCM